MLTWVVKIALAYLVVGSAELGYALESFSLRMAREIPAVTAERITEGIHTIIPSMSVDHLPLLCVSIGLVLMQLLNPVNLVVLAVYLSLV